MQKVFQQIFGIPMGTNCARLVADFCIRTTLISYSFCNRCVIEAFGGVFVLSHCFLDIYVGVGAFVIGLSQISSSSYKLSFLSSNMPLSSAYGVFISQLIRNVRACSPYEYFNMRAVLLSCKLPGQGYVRERLK